MRSLVIEPKGWPCALAECPSGLFLFEDYLGFKSEYKDPYVVGSGEAFWGGTSKEEERDALTVQPCRHVWR